MTPNGTAPPQESASERGDALPRPDRETSPPAAPHAGPAVGAGLDGRLLRPVTIPIAISALANVVAGYLWFLASCFGLFISAPLLVLATFELWTLLRSTQLDLGDFKRRVTVLGLLELLAGVFNLASLLCGTLALLNLGRVERRLSERPPDPPA